jgi:hypothetical protein
LIALAAAAASKSPSAWDQPGTLGFLVVFGMGVILFFVFRSLARHLRKINEAARLEALQAGDEQADALHSGSLPSGSLHSGSLPSGSLPSGSLHSESAQPGSAGSDSGEPRNDFTRSAYERQQSEQNAIDLDF